jgi:hypothetical protein
MSRLSAEDFYELSPKGDIRRWSRAHWGLEDRGVVEFCAPVGPYRDGCPPSGAPPGAYIAQLRTNFLVAGFLEHSAAFQLAAPALAGVLQSLLAESPDTAGLAVRLRRTPELGGGVAVIRAGLRRGEVEVARTAIRRPGVRTTGSPDPLGLHYTEGLELADWKFSSDRYFRGRAVLALGQSRWLDLLAEHFAPDLRELL